MPRVTELTDSEDGHVLTGSTKKTYAGKKRRAVSASEDDVEEVVKEVNEGPENSTADGDEEEGEEEEEEEYEIEAILDAKKGHFPGGRTGYLVKWRGYGDEHNSWVDERDAGNATEVIDNFWAEKKKNKAGPRKSEPIKPKPKVVEKPSRKSLIEIESSVEPDAVVVKKRSRPRKDEQPSDKPEVRDDDGDEQRVKKKPRKSNGHTRPANTRGSDEEDIIGNMKKHMKVSSWEDLVETIDTVEREEDGELYVFFTLKNDKKRVRENSRVCAEKFPQKLIMFYESNLRWKTEDDPVDVE